MCVKSEHTNHVQHINKCALCWAFKLKTSRLHGIAETIWEWNPFAVYPVKTRAAGNTGQQWISLYRYQLHYTIFTGYLAFVLLPLCLLFLLLFRLLHSNNNDCNLQKAKRIWSALAHTHTHSWGSNSCVSERERERETECRFVYPVRDNTFKRADIARFALPSGKWTKVCSSCGQLRGAAAFAASAKYIENLTACLPALPACHPHSSLLEALKTAFCICLSVCELRTKFATH